MEKITVETDGTITGTKLTVDGEEITKANNIVGIYLSASSPYKSKYSGDIYKGYVSVDYVSVDDKGVAERKSYGTPDANYQNGIGKKLKTEDRVEDQIIRFMGQDSDVEVTKLVDIISTKSKEKGIACPDKNTLLSRNIQSLRDKAADLGIKEEELNG